MEWMTYLIGGIAVSAAALALYERRKNKRLLHDDLSDPSYKHPGVNRDHAAHANAEQIRAEGQVSQQPNGGSGRGIF